MSCKTNSVPYRNPRYFIHTVICSYQVGTFIREWNQVCLRRPIFHRVTLIGFNLITIFCQLNPESSSYYLSEDCCLGSQSCPAWLICLLRLDFWHNTVHFWLFHNAWKSVFIASLNFITPVLRMTVLMLQTQDFYYILILPFCRMSTLEDTIAGTVRGMCLTEYWPSLSEISNKSRSSFWKTFPSFF